MFLSVFRGERSQYKSVAGGVFAVCIALLLSSCSAIPGSDTKSKEHSLSSLQISPVNPTVGIGDSERFAVTGVFADGTREDMSTAVSWTSTNPEVALINQTGVALAKESGTTTITVSSGAVSASTTITVPAAILISITVGAPSFALNQGATEQLVATGSYSDGTSRDLTSSVAWASTTAGVASVSSTGMFTATAAGNTTVTASLGQIRGAQMFTVSPTAVQPGLVSIAISPSSVSLAKGRTQQLSVTGSFSDGSTADVTASVAWTISPASLGTISKSGLISGAATGTGTITAISGSISGSAALAVLPPLLTALAISPQNPSIAKGATLQLTAMGTFSDGTTQNVTNSVTWSVSSGNAAISSSGMVNALGSGTATISAASGSVAASDAITLLAASLVSLSISPANPSVAKGTTQQLTVTGIFSDGTAHDVTNTVLWTVSPGTVLGVSKTGLITTLAVGAATVTATSGSVSAPDSITILPAALVSIAVSPANPSIPKGETQQLTATGTYTDGTTQDITKQATWTSSTAAVATVNNAGLLTSQTVGAAIVTATLGQVNGIDAVAVLPPVVVSIAVTPVKASITLDQTLQFQATGTFSDGTTQDLTASATWAAAQTAVAAISAGLVTPQQLGKTAITATSGTVTGSAALSVNKAVLVSISITPATQSIPLGELAQLKATGNYDDGSTQDLTQEVAWSSSQLNIATVNSNGVDTGKQVGKATITATLGAKSGSVPVTVTAPAIVSIALTPAHPYLPISGSVQLAATATFSNSSTADITNQALWSVTNTNIVTVSSGGLASAKAAGTVTITASSGQSSASIAVVVAPVSITIVPASISITTGRSAPLSATATFGDGTSSDVTSAVDWSTANSQVAQITDGRVAGLTAGTTSISASIGPVSESATVTVQSEQLVDYFDNSQTTGIDATVRISNPGSTGDDLCAMVYVYAADQQLTECCGCPVTPNGLRTFSLNTDLTSNPMTGQIPARGTVDVVPAEAVTNSTCDPTTSYTPSGVLMMWTTHIQNPAGGSAVVTETPYPGTPLPATDLQHLQLQCSFLQQAGGGQGVCSCGSGD